MLIVNGYIENFGNDLYIGWTKELKGLVVEGHSIDEVKKELWTSLKVKVAHDFNIDITGLKLKELKPEDLAKITQISEKNYEFQLM